MLLGDIKKNRNIWDLDIDDFVTPYEDNSLGDIVDAILEQNKNAAGIAMNWRFYVLMVMRRNPYIFKVHGKLVRIRFSDTDKTAEECLINVIKNLYR